MPGLDGKTLLKKIKKHPKIIGIILTGYMDDALKLKINDPKIFFLEKLYSICDIIHTIEKALNP